MSTTNSLDIVIVNWNSGAQLRECLDAIAGAELTGVVLENVIVVDNHSTDGSANCLENADLPLRLIKNNGNVGFARGCNQGAAAGAAGTILFLNPDMRLFETSLSRPVAFLNSAASGNVGIVGVQLVDESGKVARSCARFPTPKTMVPQMMGLDRIFPNAFPAHFLGESHHGANRSVDQVMGAFFMVRRTLFEQLNGFDERFFVYYEDLDFSLRARKAGYGSWFMADASAFHRGCGTSDAVKTERLYYYQASRIRYGFKHFGRRIAWFLTGATLFVEMPVRLGVSLVRGGFRELAETLHAFLLLVKNLPKMTSAKGRAEP